MIDDVDRVAGQPASPSPDESLGYWQHGLLPRKPVSPSPDASPAVSSPAATQPATTTTSTCATALSFASIMGGQQHATHRSPQTSPTLIV